MNGAFGSPITAFSEWFSSTMMNTRSSRTPCWPSAGRWPDAAALLAASPMESAASAVADIAAPNLTRLAVVLMRIDASRADAA